MRPTAEYPIGVEYGEGFVRVRLYVLDVSVGGVGLELIAPILGYAAGREIALTITLPGFPKFKTAGRVRYNEGRGGGRCGVHLVGLTPSQQAAMNRAVSELLERGASG